MGDHGDIFSRMFASFVNRKYRAHSRNTPPPPTTPPPALRRSPSFRGSNTSRSSARRAAGGSGISALSHLLSPSSSGRTSTSRSSRRHQPAQAALHVSDSMQNHNPFADNNHNNSGLYHHPHIQPPLDPPLPPPPLLASRRYSGRFSDKTDDGDRPPRKRSKTHERLHRSQSAHSVGSSRSRRGANNNGGGASASGGGGIAEMIAPRPAHIPKARPSSNKTGKIFPCPSCEAVFQQRGQLARHTRRVHEKLRPYECEHCGRLFGARSDRTRHIQIIHNKVRDFTCEECGFKFQAKTHLEAHTRTVHQGERPHTCNTCGFSFGLRSNLLTHQRTVHQKEAAKWRCTFCQKPFNRKHDKDRHMKLVHMPLLSSS